MRIVLLWPVYFPNYSAGSVRCGAFAEQLTILGNDVAVVTPLEFPGRSTIEMKAYMVRRIPSYYSFSRCLGFGSASILLPISIGNIRRTLVEIRPDVVIASTPGPIMALEGYLATRRMGIPFVFDVRDPWRSGSYLHPGALRNLSKQSVEKLLVRKSDFVFSVTPALREIMTSDYGISPTKVAVVRNGADVGNRGILDSEKEYDLVFLGTPSPYKGLEGLFAALKIASRKRPLKILFVGWIENSYTKGLRTLAERCSLVHSMDFLPQIPVGEVKGWISKARVAIMSLGGPPSLACAVGAANYQYLAAGLPIAFLTRHRGGEIDDFISEDVGFVATNPAVFAEKLIDLLQDENDLRRRSVNALEYSKEFGWNKIVSEMHERYLKNLVGDLS
ncbi:MAG: glycosyltransferase [Thermoplasmata archaeon]